jgi:hypothetical protein
MLSGGFCHPEPIEPVATLNGYQPYPTKAHFERLIQSSDIAGIGARHLYGIVLALSFAVPGQTGDESTRHSLKSPPP